ncbi:MAG TPA: PLP-dependent aspartate aminotransferase family protein [Candidatus Sumerlaeota bacterium]|nr:PLP-dependent aspartate aminotransferase family protein [Candidatus Sumerlaeota bacterium]
MRFATKTIRAGQPPDPVTGAVIVPIHPAVTFQFQEVGVPRAFEYSRTANPTRAALEQCLAQLEGAAHGLAFASGMAACDAVLSILDPGDHVVAAGQIYGGTFRLLQTEYARRGVTVTYVPADDPAAFARAIQPATRLVWTETPTNPLLQLTDIAAVAAAARRHAIPLVVDNTFPSPYFQRPLELGADVVIHSTTKYLGGHSDVLGGAVITNDPELHARFQFHQNNVGAVLGPFDSWLTLRGIKTLVVRMRQHEANARRVAEFLERHPRVQRTIYPGLPSHPQHDLARRQMSGFGAMVSFELDGGRQAANAFVKRLRLFLFAESLGGVESLVCHPVTMSHAALTERERAEAGITEGLLRLSVGIEDGDDLLEDLEHALAD